MGAIFPEKGEALPPDEYAELDAERREDEIAEQSRQRVEDMVGLNKEIITPTRLEHSKYHILLSKDLKLSNINENDVRLGSAYFSAINHLLFLKVTTSAKVLHAEMMEYLALKSSVGGFERKSLISTISSVLRGKPAEGGGEKQKFLR